MFFRNFCEVRKFCENAACKQHFGVAGRPSEARPHFHPSEARVAASLLLRSVSKSAKSPHFWRLKPPKKQSCIESFLTIFGQKFRNEILIKNGQKTFDVRLVFLGVLTPGHIPPFWLFLTKNWSKIDQNSRACENCSARSWDFWGSLLGLGLGAGFAFVPPGPKSPSPGQMPCSKLQGIWHISLEFARRVPSLGLPRGAEVTPFRAALPYEKQYL